MAYPISELILQDVVATLSRVTPFNSYINNFLVGREKPLGNSPIVNGQCIVMGGNEKNTDIQPDGFERKIIPIGICIYAIEPENTDQPMDQILFGMAADARKALLNGSSIYRGDYAENTVFDESDKLFINGAPPNVLLVAKVQYRHLFGDPYRIS